MAKDKDTYKFYGMKIGPMSQRSQEEIAADEHPNRCQAVVGILTKSRCKNDRMSGFSVCQRHQ
jgi:hypothetical protein